MSEILPTVAKAAGFLGMFCGSLAFITSSPVGRPSVWIVVAMIGGGALYVGQAYLFPISRRRN